MQYIQCATHGTAPDNGKGGCTFCANVNTRKLLDTIAAAKDAANAAISDVLATVGTETGDESPDMAVALNDAIAQYVRDWWSYNVALPDSQR